LYWRIYAYVAHYIWGVDTVNRAERRRQEREQKKPVPVLYPNRGAESIRVNTAKGVVDVFPGDLAGKDTPSYRDARRMLRRQAAQDKRMRGVMPCAATGGAMRKARRGKR